MSKKIHFKFFGSIKNPLLIFWYYVSCYLCGIIKEIILGFTMHPLKREKVRLYDKIDCNRYGWNLVGPQGTTGSTSSRKNFGQAGPM